MFASASPRRIWSRSLWARTMEASRLESVTYAEKPCKWTVGLLELQTISPIRSYTLLTSLTPAQPHCLLRRLYLRSGDFHSLTTRGWRSPVPFQLAGSNCAAPGNLAGISSSELSIFEPKSWNGASMPTREVGNPAFAPFGAQDKDSQRGSLSSGGSGAGK